MSIIFAIVGAASVFAALFLDHRNRQTRTFQAIAGSADRVPPVAASDMEAQTAERGPADFGKRLRRAHGRLKLLAPAVS